MSDDDLPKLPTWKEFRPRRARESPVDYLHAKLEADISQERDRDHWFMSTVVQHLMINVELLHNDLLGDGTVRRRGVLHQLIEEQKEQSERILAIPSLVRKTIADAHVKQQANEWGTVKKFTYGVLSLTLATFIAALIWLLVVGHK